SATHEVRMDVRFGDVRYAQPFLLRGVDVLLHVAIRVHDDGLSRRLTADYVAGLGEAAVVESLKEHDYGSGKMIGFSWIADCSWMQPWALRRVRTCRGSPLR